MQKIRHIHITSHLPIFRRALLVIKVGRSSDSSFIIFSTFPVSQWHFEKTLLLQRRYRERFSLSSLLTLDNLSTAPIFILLSSLLIILIKLQKAIKQTYNFTLCYSQSTDIVQSSSQPSINPALTIAKFPLNYTILIQHLLDIAIWLNSFFHRNKKRLKITYKKTK